MNPRIRFAQQSTSSAGPAERASSAKPAGSTEADAAPDGGMHGPGEMHAPSRFRVLLPGIAMAVAAGILSTTVGSFIPGMSPLLLAIIVGIVVGNLVPLPAATAPGMTYSSKTLLRMGIVLLGLQVVLGDIIGLGAGMIAVVIAIVVGGILGTLAIGKLLGTSRVLTVLVACGFSICGAAAVGAVAGVVDPDQENDEDFVTAVALVVLFGTLMIPLLPLASTLLGLSNETAGLWAGGSIHEVAQVVAAGGVMGGGALAIAVIVKLARVLMLAPVIAVLSAAARRSASTSESNGSAKPPPIVPLFVAGFLAMVLVRSFIPLPEVVLSTAGIAQTLLLSTAMFALGCGVKVKSLVRVGPKPFVLATLSTLLVALIALGGVLLFG